MNRPGRDGRGAIAWIDLQSCSLGTATPRALLAVAVLAACAVGSCSFGDGGDVQRPLVIAEAPPGYQPLEEPFGAFDLDRYIRDFSDAEDSDRAILTEGGFTEGLARGWVDEAGTHALVVFGFQLRDRAGARSLRDHFATDARGRKAATDVEVSGVQQAVGLSYLEETEEGQERVNSVLLLRGSQLFVVATQHADVDAGPDRAIEFARSQNGAGR